MSRRKEKNKVHGNDQAGGARSPRALTAFLAVVVAVVVLVVHWPVLTTKALALDDDQYLTTNKLVQNPGWSSTGRFVSEVMKPSTVKGYYQPLSMISLMLDSAMGGSPRALLPFHRTSLLLHAANTALIIVLLYLLFHQTWIAVLVGLLFGVHPMTIEPVAWIGERKTVLATFFAIWSIILYVRYARQPAPVRYGASLLMFVLALLAKPTATPLPLALLILDYWPLQRLGKRALLEKLPFLAVSGVSSVITVISQRHLELSTINSFSIGQTLLLMCHNMVFYLWKMIWPFNLSPFYIFPDNVSLADGMLQVCVVANILAIAGVLLSARWTRAIAAGWLCYFILLLPTLLNKNYSPSIAWEKYVYFPSIGILMILAWLMITIVNRSPGDVRIRRGVQFTSILLAIAMAVVTRNQIARWKTTETLYQHMLSQAPNSAVLHYNIGLHLADDNRLPEAIQHYEAALKVRPNLENLENNLGNALARQGKPQEAIPHFERAIQLAPRDSKVYNNMGNALSDLGMQDKAAEYYNRALQYDADSIEAHNNLAVLYTRQGKTDLAIRHYTRALELAPEMAEAHHNLAVLLSGQGQMDKAVERYSQAVRIRPDFFEAQWNLGLALARLNRHEEAVGHYRAALRLRPREPVVHTYLGISLAQTGKTVEAIQEYQKALQLDPNNAEARKNLELTQQGRPAAP